MGLNIVSNYAADTAHRYLMQAQADATRTIAQLSSGSRVASASDDPASLAVGTRLLALATGILGMFLAVAMVAPRLVRPLASLLGWPATRVGGVAGELARANAMRNPGRTASTAAALMIGLALVTAVAVLAQGLRSAFEGAVQSQFHADYALTAADDFSPLSVVSAAALRESGIPSVVAGVRVGEGRAFGRRVQVTAVDPGISQLVTLRWTVGTAASLERLGQHGAIVAKFDGGGQCL